MESIKFKVSPSFFALTFFMLLLRQSYLFALYILAVILHEFCHYFTAKRLGYCCEKIHLSAFGAVLYGIFDDLSPKDEIRIALSGPFSNLVTALILTGVWWMFPASFAFTEMFFYANLFIGAVNLLPCYPLDGGRVFCAFLKRFHVKDPLKTVQILGYVIASGLFALFAAGLLFGAANFSLGLFSVFLFLGAMTAMSDKMYRNLLNADRLRQKVLRGTECKWIAVDEETTLYELTKKIAGGFYRIEIYRGTRCVGRWDSFDVLRLTERYPLSAPLKDLEKKLKN